MQTRKKKNVLLLSAVLSAAFLNAPAAAETANPQAAANVRHYGYPDTRVFTEGLNRNDFGETGDAGIRDDGRGNALLSVGYLKRDDGVERYHGDVWNDRYRWLEEVDEIDPEYAKETDADRKRNLVGTWAENPEHRRVRAFYEKVPQPQSSEVNNWVNAQTAATERYLRAIPYYAQVKQNIDNLLNYEYLDFEKKTDDATLRYVRHPDGYYRLTKTAADGQTRVLLNERSLSADGNTKIHKHFLSKNGRYFAYVVQEGNSDSDRLWLHVLDTETGKPAAGPIRGIDRNSASVAWRDDNSFYYLQRNGWIDVMLHRLDKKQFQDEMVLRGRTVGTSLKAVWLGHDKRYLVLEGVWGGNDMLFLKDLQSGRLMRVHNQHVMDKMKKRESFTKHIGAKFVHFEGDDIYFITQDNHANGEIMKLDLRHTGKKPERMVAALPDKRLVSAAYQNGRFLLHYTADGQHSVFLADGSGKILKDLTPAQGGFIDEVSSVEKGKEKEGNNAGKPEEESSRNHFSFRFENSITPRTIHKYSVEDGNFFEVKRKDTILFDPEQYETHHVFYTSKDGTRVPMNISHKKGLKLDGSNPTILYGYGGFGLSADVYFRPNRAAWLEHGGVFAVAFLRGGDEYGEAWHQAGKKLNKHNVFDDFAAAGEYLIDKGYTSKDRLGISGSSNGGLLVGASMVLRPDLFRVAIPEVGVLDMLRHDKNYKTDYWVDEYGIAEDSKAMYKVLKSYSPYHNVKNGVCYPSTMVMTSKRDDRVTPAHSYKFAAMLQERQGCDRPTFLYAAETQGHGPNTREDQKRNWLYTTLFHLHEMGVKELPPVPPHLPQVK